jgi:Ca2+-binding RTX toxin-like protein
MRNRTMLVATIGAAACAGVWGASSFAGAPGPTCFGQDADHVLSENNDDLDLSSETEPQVVVGLGGDDSIHGGQAGDRLCGGPGIDEVYGDAGQDRVNGEGGRDYAEGGENADLVKGGGGAEKGLITWRVGTPDEGLFGTGVDGGDGGDKVLGGSGGDEMRGEGGDDTVKGNAGVDFCNGGPGRDDVDCEEPFPQE